MNKSKLFLSAIILSVIVACSSEPKEKSSNEVLSNKSISQACYLATYENDSLFLQVDKKADNKISGKLLMKFPTKPTNDGIIEGKFVGDTLFVDYTFNVGGNKERTFKNPMAFLAEKNELIMGVGVIETSYGKSYFAKDKAINFGKGKYQFRVVECSK